MPVDEVDEEEEEEEEELNTDDGNDDGPAELADQTGNTNEEESAVNMAISLALASAFAIISFN